MSTYFSAVIFKNGIYNRLKSILLWSISSMMIFVSAILVMSTFLDSGLPDIVSGMMTSLPKELLGSLYVAESPDFSNFNINFGFCLEMLMLCACTYACHLGVSIAQEGENYFYYYSMPIGRAALLLSNYLLRLFSLLVYDSVLFAGSAIVLNIYGYSDMVYNVFIVFAVFLAAQFLLFSIGTFISCFLNSHSAVASVTGCTIAASILFWLIGSIFPVASFLKALSPCTVFNAMMMLGYGADINLLVLGLMAIVGLIFTVAGIIRIQSVKDLL